MPHHQIDRAIRKSLWLRDKTLDCKKIYISIKKNRNTKSQNETIGSRDRDKEICTDMWMVFTPSLSLLSKTTTSNTSRHGSLSLLLSVCNFSFHSLRLTLAFGVFKGAEREGENKVASSSTVPILPRMVEDLFAELLGMYGPDFIEGSAEQQISWLLCPFMFPRLVKYFPRKVNQFGISFPLFFSLFSRENHATLCLHVPHALVVETD